MLKLYHGSNVVIDKIDICRSRKGKDFGCGFYLNPDKSHRRENRLSILICLTTTYFLTKTPHYPLRFLRNIPWNGLSLS